MAVRTQSNVMPWVLAAGAGALLLYKKVHVHRSSVPGRQKEYVTRMRVTLPGIKFKGDNVDFDLFIQNPNPVGLTIDAIVGEVYITYGGKSLKVGTVSRFGSTVIQPLGETKFPFSVRTKLIQLVAYFTDVYAGKVNGQVITFTGTITVNKRPFPVKESLQLTPQTLGI